MKYFGIKLFKNIFNIFPIDIFNNFLVYFNIPHHLRWKMKVQKLTANICEIKWQPGVSIPVDVCVFVRVCVCV